MSLLLRNGVAIGLCLIQISACSEGEEQGIVAAALKPLKATSIAAKPISGNWKNAGQENSRNPFMAPPELLKKKGVGSTARVGLKDVPYRSLKLLGTVTGAADSRALVGKSAGSAFVVHKGSTIGRESAVLVDIGDREITLRVKSSAGANNWDLKVISMGGE